MPYNLPYPRTEHEKAVQRAGYRWTQTVELLPFGQTDEVCDPYEIFDRLNRHKHHSRNTHLIVTGQLTIEVKSGHKAGQKYFLDADDSNGVKELIMQAGIYYEGVAGPDGASFVEGHTVLSPATARRYETRGVIHWEEEDGVTMEQCLAWYERPRKRKLEGDLQPVVAGPLYRCH